MTGLRQAMNENGVSIASIAEVLRIHRNTASMKVNGKLSFSIQEAFVLQKALFPSHSLQELFEENK